MKKRKLTMAEIALIASTRGMLGAGIGLLLGDKLSRDQGRAIGWTLVMVGVITTIPLVINLLGQKEELGQNEELSVATSSSHPAAMSVH